MEERKEDGSEKEPLASMELPVASLPFRGSNRAGDLGSCCERASPPSTPSTGSVRVWRAEPGTSAGKGE